MSEAWPPEGASYIPLPGDTEDTQFLRPHRESAAAHTGPTGIAQPKVRLVIKVERVNPLLDLRTGDGEPIANDRGTILELDALLAQDRADAILGAVFRIMAGVQ